MTRARAVALLALGCAFAAAAASTGPLLAREPREQSFLTRLRASERFRRARGVDVRQPHGVLHWLDVATQVVVAVLVVAVLLVGLYHVVRILVRLVRLLLDRSQGRTGTVAYDDGEGTADDARTALNRRVADELTALSADLDGPGEAREVVIACYARMEAALAAAGTPRNAAESPLELLTRVLGEHDVPEADVRRLTDLFTRARFSRHPVTDEMRASARRSLANVAGALGGVPA